MECAMVCVMVCVCVKVCEGVYVWRCVMVCVLCIWGVDAHAFVYHIEREEDIDCPALSLSTLFICDMVC